MTAMVWNNSSHLTRRLVKEAPSIDSSYKSVSKLGRPVGFFGTYAALNPGTIDNTAGFETPDSCVKKFVSSEDVGAHDPAGIGCFSCLGVSESCTD